MTTPNRKNPTGSGAIIALLAMAGTIGSGYFFRQPSAGLLGGTALGSAIAILLWLRERQR